MSGRWTFCPNKSQAKSQGRDYHSSFSEATYIPYFKERLVPACERVFPGRKLCFVFDKATYHVVASYKVGEEEVSRCHTATSRTWKLLLVLSRRIGEIQCLANFLGRYPSLELNSLSSLTRLLQSLDPTCRFFAGNVVTKYC